MGALTVQPLTELPTFDLGEVLGSADPASALDRLRQDAPLWRSDVGVHVLGYQDCVELLRDGRFSRGVPQMLDSAGITDPVVRRQWLTSLLGSPTADHDRMRRLLSPSVSALRDRVTDVAADAARAAAGRGHLDAMGDLAVAIPPAVFCRMIGAPDADAPFIGRVSAQILEIFARRPELAPSIEAATHELVDYVLAFVADRRGAPRGSDLISNLLTAEEAGDRVSTDELVALVIEVLEASTDNTSSQLALVLHAAAQDPARWEALRADPARIPAFVEEASRLWARIVCIAKVAEEDLTFAGVDVPAGTTVLATVPSAHRDPVAHVDPYRFDPDRGSKALNLNYGTGGHYCIGASLARMEMCGALEVLTRAWAAIRPAGELVGDVNVGVVTVRSLPLEVVPA